MNKSEAMQKWIWLNQNHWSQSNVADLQEKYNQIVLDVYNTTFGKHEKNSDKAWQGLIKKLGVVKTRDIVDNNSVVVELKRESQSRHDAIRVEEESIKNELKLFAKSYETEKLPEMICVKIASLIDYRTQTASSTYAKNSLLNDYTSLKILGFDVELKFVQEKEYSFSKWELWANISQFDFYMLGYGSKFISFLNWCVLMWRNGSNPKVYCGGVMPNDDYEKSLVLYRNHNYVITGENMMLEPSWEEIKKMDGYKP